MQQPLEQAVAETILQRFESFYSRFLEITQGSKSRFENSDWLGVQLAGRERIRLYDHHVGATTALIKQMMGATLPSQALLKQVKGAFSDLLPKCENFEVAESFFNSVYRRIFRHRNIRDENLYIHPFRSRGEHPDLSTLLRIYRTDLAHLPQTLSQLLGITASPCPMRTNSGILSTSSAILPRTGRPSCTMSRSPSSCSRRCSTATRAPIWWG